MAGNVNVGGKLIINTQLDYTMLTNRYFSKHVKFVKDNFVIKSGDTMLNNLDMASNKLITTAIASAKSDLTNKKYDDMKQEI
ncbi:hypothetical protein ACJMK2_003977 [Sinanodonta woodiana]|uniref:Uncharacterized protein n=1 Tax=Sinanodonta woodiana TaxID=1069815 RepID=A0ABD3Y2T5_SINWO